MERRKFLAALAAPLGIALALTATHAPAYPAHRHVRVRVRHHIRRHAFLRVVHGRPMWVVPVHLAVGWELMHAGQVVVVREIRVVERDGRRSEVAVIRDGKGLTEEVEITREDMPDNQVDLAGSAIDASDVATPALEDSLH